VALVVAMATEPVESPLTRAGACPGRGSRKRPEATKQATAGFRVCCVSERLARLAIAARSY
jgi:hypothetical protein